MLLEKGQTLREQELPFCPEGSWVASGFGVTVALKAPHTLFFCLALSSPSLRFLQAFEPQEGGVNLLLYQNQVAPKERTQQPVVENISLSQQLHVLADAVPFKKVFAETNAHDASESRGVVAEAAALLCSLADERCDSHQTGKEAPSVEFEVGVALLEGF